jgi:transcriptional regulator with XRE-family HTH domain
VKELRDAKGWSQAQLAERAGTHFTTVSKVESGERSASLRLALVLADALGVSVARLIPRDWKDRLIGGQAKPAERAPGEVKPQSGGAGGKRPRRRTGAPGRG